MIKKFKSPDTYLQGRGVVSNLGEYVSHMGKKGMLIADETVMDIVKGPVKESFDSQNISFEMELFNGECTKAEIERITESGQKSGIDFIVGAGGGKTLDTAKAAGSNLEIPFVTAPTIASTDAPTSYQSVIYTEDGEFVKLVYHDQHPRIVAVDTEVIAEAPTRTFVAGMGDALATWFEAKTCHEAGNSNEVGGEATGAALSMAELCYDNLRDFGEAAVEAVKADLVTPAVEEVVESNVLLSGLGFENGGLAIAHSIHNGLTALEETHGYLHGEKVAFGTLVQLVMENKKTSEVVDVMEFCLDVGLPITLEGVGLDDVTDEKLNKVAEKAIEPQESIHYEPFEVRASMVADAIAAVNKLGEKIIKRGN